LRSACPWCSPTARISRRTHCMGPGSSPRPSPGFVLGRTAAVTAVGANRGGARYRLGVCGLPGHGLRVPGRRLRNRRRSLAGVAGPTAWAIVAALVGRASLFTGCSAAGGWRGAPGWPGRCPRRIGDRRRATRSTVKRAAGWATAKARRGQAATRAPSRSTGCTWSSGPGLRRCRLDGAGALLPIDFPNRTALQGITFGVVLFTLMVQATTADFAVGRWGGKAAPRSKASRRGRTSGARKTVRAIDPPASGRVRVRGRSPGPTT